MNVLQRLSHMKQVSCVNCMSVAGLFKTSCHCCNAPSDCLEINLLLRDNNTSLVNVL